MGRSYRVMLEVAVEPLKGNLAKRGNEYQEWIEMIKSDEIKIEQLSFKSLLLLVF